MGATPGTGEGAPGAGPGTAPAKPVAAETPAAEVGQKPITPEQPKGSANDVAQIEAIITDLDPQKIGKLGDNERRGLLYLLAEKGSVGFLRARMNREVRQLQEKGAKSEVIHKRLNFLRRMSSRAEKIASEADAKIEQMAQDKDNPEGQALGHYFQEFFVSQEIGEIDAQILELNSEKNEAAGDEAKKIETSIIRLNKQKVEAEKRLNASRTEREKIVSKDGKEIGKETPVKVANEVVQLANELDDPKKPLSTEEKLAREQQIRNDPMSYLINVINNASADKQLTKQLVTTLTSKGYATESQAKNFEEFLSLSREEMNLKAKDIAKKTGTVSVGIGGVLILMMYISTKQKKEGMMG